VECSTKLILNYLLRGVWLLLIVAVISFFFDMAEHSRIFLTQNGWIVKGYHKYIDPSILHLPVLDWPLMLLFVLYLSRLVRAIRNSLVSD